MRGHERVRGAFVAALTLAGCGSPDLGGTDTSSTSAAAASTTDTTGTSAEAVTTTTPTGGTDSGGATTSTTSTTTTTEPPEPPTSSGATTTTTDAVEDTSAGGDTDETAGEAPLDELLTLQHVQVKGTHNSYHLEPAIPFHASHKYSHAPLAVQLGSQGVRAFELDVHRGIGGFEVYHITVIDSSTTCSTLADCIGDLRGWSEAHPAHLPIVVWIEIKDSTGGLPIGAGDLDALDDVIRGALTPEQLFTPDELQGGHPSVRAALEAEGWPTLAELRGRFLFVLLNVEDAHAERYTASYTSLAGRAMFARATPAQFSAPWAAIAKLGVDEAEAQAQAHAARLLIATNVCAADDDDSTCTERLMKAKAAGIHMLKDDFPAPVAQKAYFLDLPDGNPARCNPVTAPPECTSEALEDL
jgi:hypothetical protein